METRILRAKGTPDFLIRKKLKVSMTVARQYFQKLFQFLGSDL